MSLLGSAFRLEYHLHIMGMLSGSDATSCQPTLTRLPRTETTPFVPLVCRYDWCNFCNQNLRTHFRAGHQLNVSEMTSWTLSAASLGLPYKRGEDCCTYRRTQKNTTMVGGRSVISEHILIGSVEGSVWVYESFEED